MTSLIRRGLLTGGGVALTAGLLSSRGAAAEQLATGASEREATRPRREPLDPLRKLARLAAAANAPRFRPVLPNPPAIAAVADPDIGLPNRWRWDDAIRGQLFSYNGQIIVDAGMLAVKGATINGVSARQGARITFLADCVKLGMMNKWDFVPASEPIDWPRFIVDGQYVDFVGTEPHAAGSNGFVFDWTHAGGRALRRITVELSGNSRFAHLSVGPTESIKPIGGESLKFVVMTDSYGDGHSADNFADVWPRHLGDLLGATAVDIRAIGGTGLIAGAPNRAKDRIQDIITAGADIILWAIGSNDINMPVADVTAAQTEALRTIRADARTAMTPIFVFGNWTHSSGPNAAHFINEATLFAGAAALNDPLIFTVPVCSLAGGPLMSGTGHVGAPNNSGSTDIYIAPGGHPTTAGHLFMARIFAGEILQIVSRVI